MSLISDLMGLGTPAAVASLLGQTYVAQANMVSLMGFFSTAQQADVLAGTARLDLTNALNSAFAAGVPLYAPAGKYIHFGQLIVPPNTPFYLQGAGVRTIFQALSPMAVQLYRAGLDVAGSDVSSCVLRDLTFDCRRNATLGVYMGAGKGGYFEDLLIQNFLGTGFQGGDNSGLFSANFYENHLNRVKCDGGIAYAQGTTAGMATTGILLTGNASDNFLLQPICSYLTTAGIDVVGGDNTIHAPHSYGFNASATGPLFNVRVGGTGTCIVDPECDNQTQAGIQINADNCSLAGGIYVWSVGNTPGVGGPVPVEIGAAPPTAPAIMGGTVRGANSSNPSVRYLGSHPDRMTLLGLSPSYRSPGDIGVNHIERSFSISKSPGVPSLIGIDVSAGQTASLNMYVAAKQAMQLGLDGTALGGGNTGQNIILETFADDGTTVTATIFKAFRTGSLALGVPTQFSPYTRATVPTPSAGLKGFTICVTDLTAEPTYKQNLTALTGGGALAANFICPDGANWLAS